DFAQIAGKPTTGVAFATRRGIDVDEAARQLDDINACANYLIHASSSVRVSVRESRYFTMTGVARDSPHSGPLPTVTARAPGTTTAPSGMTRGSSGVGRMISPRTRSYTGVDPVSTVPAPTTARVLMIAPSYTPVFPPMSTSSSMMTGSAPTGSM